MPLKYILWTRLSNFMWDWIVCIKLLEVTVLQKSPGVSRQLHFPSRSIPVGPQSRDPPGTAGTPCWKRHRVLHRNQKTPTVFKENNKIILPKRWHTFKIREHGSGSGSGSGSGLVVPFQKQRSRHCLWHIFFLYPIFVHMQITIVLGCVFKLYTDRVPFFHIVIYVRFL